VNTIVLDASIAAKWFLPANGETLVEEANALLDQYVKGEVWLIVPDLFWPEIGNILWKAACRNRCTKESAEKAISSLATRKLPTISSEQLLPEALAIATAFDRTVYDSVYVALAITAKSQLVTADERLANALAARLPVKWLGAL
jgi:predicted nucleic acid-binding protein